MSAPLPARRRFLGAALAASALPFASRSGAAPPGGVALVLGGGGCRAYGHIGVLRVLEREQLRPDLVVGASAGSLVGAFFAAGTPVAAIEKYGRNMSPNLMRDWVFPKLGLFGGKRIRRFVVDRLGARTIESLPLRFAAVATDLRTGETVTLARGDLGTAVQASSSAPGLLEPVRLEGRLLVDGNLASPVPVDVARRLGARRVIAVDVTFPPSEAVLDDPYDALYQGFSILTRKLALEERAKADAVIAPELPEHNSMSPSVLQGMMDAGEQAARRALPELRALFG